MKTICMWFETSDMGNYSLSWYYDHPINLNKISYRSSTSKALQKTFENRVKQGVEHFYNKRSFKTTTS